MKVYSIEDRPVIEDSVATIGIFDGVHRGHKYILNALIEGARKSGGQSVVISLWPHPRIVLSKESSDFRLLHSAQEKILHLEKLGIDNYVVIPFDQHLASMRACDFSSEYLVKRLKVKRLLLGYDNSFGKDRIGNPNTLAECAAKEGLIVDKLDEFKPLDINISSTSIRNALLAGDLELAARMLDYPYYLAGEVVRGDQLGRKLGYPTANVNPHTAYKLIPRGGVYAVEVEYQNRRYPGMLNIGIRPTIDSPAPVKTIEAHLFDVDIDLYDEKVVIHFLKRIRDEQRFPNLEALKVQLSRDEAQIKAYFQANHN